MCIRDSIDDIGYATRLFLSLIRALPQLLKRPRLITDQTFFIGNKSLVIICVSGLFVGFVLGLQGYYILVRYGSEQALGVLVALALTREPVSYTHLILSILLDELPVGTAAALTAKITGIRKNRLYEMALALRETAD